MLTSKSNINYLYASLINIIFYVQMFIIFSLPTYNLAIDQDSDIYFLIEKGILFILLKVIFCLFQGIY